MANKYNPLPPKTMEQLYAEMDRNSVPIPESGCMIWLGRQNKPNGYGQIRVSRTPEKHVFTHRLTYERFRGEIADGLRVCHTCDTPSCINPNHLFLGTQKDNIQDMLSKGRGRYQKGELCINR